jgi:hypothetical protein
VGAGENWVRDHHDKTLALSAHAPLVAVAAGALRWNAKSAPASAHAELVSFLKPPAARQAGCGPTLFVHRSTSLYRLLKPSSKIALPA